MITLTQLLIILCVSVDGFCLGCALGLSRFKLTVPLFLFMGLISSVLCFTAMKIGSLFFGIITEQSCALLCSFIFFLLAYLALCDKKNDNQYDKYNTFTTAALGGFAVAVDASFAAFSLSLDGAEPILFSILFGISHFVLISLGYLCSRSLLSKKIRENIPSVSAILLTILGILRLI